MIYYLQVIFITQRWILKKIYFKVDNGLLKLRAESSRRFEMPKCQHSEVPASLPVPAHTPRAPPTLPWFSTPYQLSGPSITAPAAPQPCLFLAMGPDVLDLDHLWADLPAWPLQPHNCRVTQWSGP